MSEETGWLKSGDQSDRSLPDRVFVAIDGSEATFAMVRFGSWLAGITKAPWEAVFAETPAAQHPDTLSRASEGLTLAAQLGATVYRFPAARAVDAIHSHLTGCPVPHVVIAARQRSFWRRLAAPSLASALTARDPRLVIHMISADEANASPRRGQPAPSASASDYLKSMGLVGLTLAITMMLALATGSRNMSFLLLFPVITAASLLGLRPALFAAFLSTAGFNLLFLKPVRHFDPFAGQSWLMLLVLGGVAIYTAWLNGALRARLALSDRTAQEAARLTAFAQNLTRVADWTSTGQAVCEEVRLLLDVRTLVFREIGGKLDIVASDPPAQSLDPLDWTALELAWATGEPTGSGSASLGNASWQFHPLKTSLGTLAVLALAREDGRNPVPVEREVLLGTIIAQAALAHERLRLEDEAIAERCGVQ